MTETLTPKERVALREIGNGGAQPHISTPVTDHLIVLGLVIQKLGKLALTLNGVKNLGERPE